MTHTHHFTIVKFTSEVLKKIYKNINSNLYIIVKYVRYL